MLRLAPLLQQLLPLRWSRTPLLPSGDVGNIAAEGQGEARATKGTEARATKGAEINSLRGGQSRDFLACLSDLVSTGRH